MIDYYLVGQYREQKIRTKELLRGSSFNLEIFVDKEHAFDYHKIKRTNVLTGKESLFSGGAAV